MIHKKYFFCWEFPFILDQQEWFIYVSECINRCVRMYQQNVRMYQQNARYAFFGGIKKPGGLHQSKGDLENAQNVGFLWKSVILGGIKKPGGLHQSKGDLEDAQNLPRNGMPWLGLGWNSATMQENMLNNMNLIFPMPYLPIFN